MQRSPCMTDVLVVDDDADLSTATAELLEAVGYTVRTASNGLEALGEVARRRPDVIVLDVEMPVLDGPSTAIELVLQDAGKELIPVVLSSGYSELAAVADRLGTPYFVKKPCSVDELVGVLARASMERVPLHPRLQRASERVAP